MRGFDILEQDCVREAALAGAILRFWTGSIGHEGSRVETSVGVNRYNRVD